MLTRGIRRCCVKEDWASFDKGLQFLSLGSKIYAGADEWSQLILSDLIAGLIAAAILRALIFLARRVGPERGRRWADKLHPIRWPLLACVFFATSLISAILGHYMGKAPTAST